MTYIERDPNAEPTRPPDALLRPGDNPLADSLIAENERLRRERDEWMTEAQQLRAGRVSIVLEDGDRFMTFKRSDIIQYLGTWVLPPWQDHDGKPLGGRVNCADLGGRAVAALDAIEV